MLPAQGSCSPVSSCISISSPTEQQGFLCVTPLCGWFRSQIPGQIWQNELGITPAKQTTNRRWSRSTVEELKAIKLSQLTVNLFHLILMLLFHRMDNRQYCKQWMQKWNYIKCGGLWYWEKAALSSFKQQICRRIDTDFKVKQKISACQSTSTWVSITWCRASPTGNLPNLPFVSQNWLK